MHPWRPSSLPARLFYRLKPFVPRSLQISLRKARARRLRSRYSDVWPIDSAASRVPGGWPGWPQGKQFALVLTHDVESSLGVARCPDLMRLEQGLGFRSSFNFVAADYEVPGELRDTLSGNGFETGIHGLHHSARMYFSRDAFSSHARRINRYFRDWGAVGFRSPAMYHNLPWMHALDIEYDASTFDTDPFEPQPDGAGTIFPFWVAHRDGTTGFVELPYTLAQDFTLFVVLGEPTIDIWRKKLDWIAEHGGMALLITHPDYMSPDEDRMGREEYPARHYRQFLEYIRDTYRGQYWHALPKEVAAFCRASVRDAAAEPRTGGLGNLHVCMPTYSFYESDNRVKRYAESLSAEGGTVDVLSLQASGQPPFEIINGVRVHRIQRRSKDEKFKWAYLSKLLLFFLRSTLWIASSHLRRPYDLVHAHNIPDFEVFAAIVPKLAGSKVILDIHDIVPELFCSKFANSTRSLWFRILRLLEKWSASFADHVIISNDLWGDRITERSVGRDKCTVLINYPDPSLFHRRYACPDGTRDFILYPGSLNHHQGLDIAIGAFSRILDRVPEVDFHIYGDGPALGELIELAAELGIAERVKFLGSKPIQQIAEIMACARCGVVPKRANLFGNEAFSTKVLEFMALGVPIVLSATAIDRHYFKDSQVLFFESGNEESLAEKLLLALTNEKIRREIVDTSLEFVGRNNWGCKKEIYFSVVESLMREGKQRVE